MTRRRLTALQRARIFDSHEGVCTFCRLKIDGVREPWDVSHDVPLALGGADDETNWRPAHQSCHRQHTAEVDAPQIAKAKRVRAKHIGAKPPPKRPMAGSRASKWKKRLDGTVVRRDESH